MTIIKGLQARIETLEVIMGDERIKDLESEIKSIKWIVVEAMKIAERNEYAIDSIAKLLQRDPGAMKQPISKGSRPKLILNAKREKDE